MPIKGKSRLNALFAIGDERLWFKIEARDAVTVLMFNCVTPLMLRPSFFIEPNRIYVQQRPSTRFSREHLIALTVYYGYQVEADRL